MNEVIDSIKTPNISIFDPKLGNVVQIGRYPTQTNEILVRSNLGVSLFDIDTSSDQKINLGLNEQKFETALEEGLFPQFNGLEGLTKNLKIYTTFNSFTLSSIINSDEILAEEDGIGNALGESIYGDDIEDIFGDMDPNEQQRAQIELGYQGGTGDDAFNENVNKAIFKTLQRDLLRFKAKTMQRILAKKLDLSVSNNPNAEYPENPSSLGELRNYIIPQQGFETSPTAFLGPEGGTAESVQERRERESLNEMTVYNGGFTPEDAGIEIKGLDERYIRKNDQSFIRWDALVLLINEALVTTNEKGEKPVYLVCDKIVDLGNKTSRYDPLKYNQIIVTDPRPVEATSDEAVRRAAGVSGKVVVDFSCDPNICILPHQFDENIRVAQERQSDYFPPDNYLEVIGYKPDISMFTNKYHTSIFNKDPGTVLYDDKILKSGTRLNTTDKNFRIGNIFLNIEMLDELAESNSDKTDYTLGNFINDIWGKVNEVCPNHNFVLTDDKEANVCYIIDLPVNQKDIPKDYHEFIPFSNKNVLRAFDYTSNVPSALSATIAIQAQDPRSIQDIDGVTFAVFNRAIKNRIQSADASSNFGKTTTAINNAEIERILKNQQLFEELVNFQVQFFENITAQANDKKLPASNIRGVLKQFQANSEYINVAKDAKKGSSFNSVIPLEFNAELDGISGMVIGNIFKIQKDRLPRAYKNANIGFIVFNEEQSITAGGDWTTKIGGKMTILND
jgi:hypothetical protein